MKLTTLLLSLIISSFAMAHGSIELIECSSTSTGIFVQAEAIEGETNVFHLSIKEEGKDIANYHNVAVELSDTIENQTIIENIKFDQQGLSGHILIQEIWYKEMRNGEGTISAKEIGTINDFNCLALY